MAYSKTVWVDDSTPAIDAAHLNNIEDGIEGLDIRMSSAESDIATNASHIATNAANILTNANNHSDLVTDLGGAIIIKSGTFSGTWNPTLTGTFGVSTPSDYNWVINVHQTSWTAGNADPIVLDGYLDVDGNTVRFTSSVDGVSKTARYSLVGYHVDYSSAAVVNG
jgi:hypothetical protein